MSNQLLFTVRNFLYRLTFGYSVHSFWGPRKIEVISFSKKFSVQTEQTDISREKEKERLDQ